LDVVAVVKSGGIKSFFLVITTTRILEMLFG